MLVTLVQQTLGISLRRAFRVLKQPRSTQRYQAQMNEQEPGLTERIVALASQYGRYGYRRVTALLWQGGWSVNRPPALEAMMVSSPFHLVSGPTQRAVQIVGTGQGGNRSAGRVAAGSQSAFGKASAADELKTKRPGHHPAGSYPGHCRRTFATKYRSETTDLALFGRSVTLVGFEPTTN